MSPGKRLSPRSTRRFRVRSVLCLVCQCDDNGFIARNAGWRVEPRRASLNSVRSLSSVVNTVLPVTCLLYSACERTARQPGDDSFLAAGPRFGNLLPARDTGCVRSPAGLLLQIPSCRGRLPDLRRYRQELARPRRLRPDPRRRHTPDLDPSSRLSRISCRLLLPSLDASTTTLSCWSDRHRPDRPASSSPTWPAAPSPTALPNQRFFGHALSLHRELRGRSAGRDAQHFLCGGSTRLRDRRLHTLQTEAAWPGRHGRGAGQLGRWHPAASRWRHPADGDRLFLFWERWKEPLLAGTLLGGRRSVAIPSLLWFLGRSATGASSISFMPLVPATPVIPTNSFRWLR